MNPRNMTVGVCGFGRCGSTMMMRMLAAGGCAPVAGAENPPHESTNLRTLWSMSPRQLEGRAVKLLNAPMLYNSVPVAHEWRFVWLDRNPLEQARSHIKFLTGIGGVSIQDVPGAVAKFAASYGSDRPRIVPLLRRNGPVLVMRYERILEHPHRAAKQLRLIWPDLDTDKAAAVVHDRDGTCRPDLSEELRISRLGHADA